MIKACIEKIRSNECAINCFSAIYRLVMCVGGKIRLKGRNNKLVRKGTFMRSCTIIVNGDNNYIEFEKSRYRITGMLIKISGNGNHLKIGKNFATDGLSITMEDNNNRVVIGDECHGGGASEFAAIEGTQIRLGNDCMLSANITIRTGDSHSILDENTGDRINLSKDVIIGNHVWIGNTVLIFKGTEIESNSIVAGGSVVTGKKFPKHSIIGGNPAIVIKENIDWCSKRI